MFRIAVWVDNPEACSAEKGAHKGLPKFVLKGQEIQASAYEHLLC